MSLKNTACALVNKRFGLNDLAQFSGVDTKLLKKWQNWYREGRELTPDSFRNGRVNHQLLQDMINQLSNGLFTAGGQGKGLADCYLNEDRVETKAFNKKDTTFHVAASSFFAKNCKVPEYRALLEKDPSGQLARNFVFKHSYSGNQYYLLTSTAKLECDFDEIELILVTKDTLVDCLSSENVLRAVLSKLYDATTKLELLEEKRVASA